MSLFIIGLVLLIAGYFIYGNLVEKILAPDDRTTPAVKMQDGVDYLVLPKWKNMLIQLLNIAGVGPVIGVILGIKFGEIVFLLIPVGNIIGGAVHDFAAGMMSLRKGGANLPTLVRDCAGKNIYRIFSIFMCVLLLLVVAVFITTPAQLINGFAPSGNIFWYASAAIFIYYIAATLFPVDKIIGRFYPIFGGLLLLGTIALFARLIYLCALNPALLAESTEFQAGMFSPEKNQPIIPLLFVTIACGILSGFHATQSPIVARTMRHEREAKVTFYGMMVLEGFIAMVWAAAALAIYNTFPALMNVPPAKVLNNLTSYFLGSGVGAVTVISVIILSITSGDTAMRSLRLSLAEIFGVSQKEAVKRILLTLPLIAIVCFLLWWANISAATFNQCWNYFAWGNQVLGASTLIIATIWLISEQKFFFITLLPAIFMIFIVTTYITWISPAHGGPVGFGLDLDHAYIVAGLITFVLAICAVKRGFDMRDELEKKQ